MLNLDDSTKWAETILNRIKPAQDDRDFPKLREIIKAHEGNLAEPRYIDILNWWIKARQAEFDNQLRISM